MTVNNKPFVQTESLLSALKTFFICVLLLFGAMSISKDLNKLVLAPLEAIMDKVNSMAKDPFQTITEEEELQLNRQQNEKDAPEEENAKFETYILNNAIIKIG